MESIRSDMEGGIKQLVQDQVTQPGACYVTLAQFDTEYELLYHAMPAREVTGYQLIPRGRTALLDAIGRTIGEVRGWIDQVLVDRRPDQVVFAVVTDGMENASREWSRQKVMDAVKEQTEAGWHFSFLGANQDAIREGGSVGVRGASAMTFDASAPGVAAAMSSLGASVRRLRSGADSALKYTDEERRRSRGD